MNMKIWIIVLAIIFSAYADDAVAKIETKPTDSKSSLSCSSILNQKLP
jgi:hypothetical protein